MIIAKNYFTLNDTLISLLFSDEAKQIGQLYINFTTPKMNNGKYFILNYYNFNILLKQTKDQNTIYHTINDDFFQEFSVHKNKMYFCGTLSDNCFMLNEVNYTIEPKKMGLYVKKKILNAFKSRGIDLLIPLNLNKDGKITRMVIA